MNRPASRALRLLHSLLALGTGLAIISACAATVADARKYFEQPRARAGDREITYRIAEATTTIEQRWQNACYDRLDVICASGEATYRDHIGPRNR